MSIDDDVRSELLAHLRESWGFLEWAPLHDVASDLVRQGLRLVAPCNQASVCADVMAELDDDSARDRP